MEKINTPETTRKELIAIEDSISRKGKASWSVLFRKGIRTPLIAGAILALLSQFTGINAIIYYGPRIMEEAGIQLTEALGGQVIIGIVIVVATIFAVIKVDKIGRKKLIFIGVIGMFVSLVIIALLFQFMQSVGIVLLIFIISFITFFSIGFGPVVWIILSEIFPTNVRGRAVSVATFVLWVGTALIGQLVPWMLETLTPAGTFLTFAIFCIPVPFILKLLPETKGMSLEDIEEVWRSEKAN